MHVAESTSVDLVSTFTLRQKFFEADVNLHIHTPEHSRLCYSQGFN